MNSGPIAGGDKGIGQQWPIGFGPGLEGCGPLAAVVGRKSTPFHGADGAGALRASASNGPSVSVQAWRAAVPRSRASPISTHLTAPTERAPSWESASNGPSVSVQAWRAAVPRAALRRYQHHFTAPTERTPSRESASNGPSVSVQAWRAAVPRSRGRP